MLKQKKEKAPLQLVMMIILLQFINVESIITPTLVSEIAIRAIDSNKNCMPNCSPWTICKNNTCICRETNKTSFVECSSKNLQLKSKKCYCVTYDNQTKEIQVGSCIEGCTNATSKPGVYYYLPTDPTKINTFMCEERWNRTGRLCGTCLPGYAPLAYSYDMRCIKCPQGIGNVWKYILVAYGPLTLFYFIVLFFKINATASHLHGFLYYSQVISVPAFARLTYLSVAGNIKLSAAFHIIAPIYSIWSLDILRSLQLEICLNVSTLTLMALNWGLAMYPLLLTLISYCMIELHDRNYRVVVWLWRPFRCIFIAMRKNWNVKNSIIDAYVTFFLLSFVKLLNISIDILTPSKVTELTTGNSTWVLYYDGTVDYFGVTHLPYVILTIIIDLVLIVAPVILLVLYPFKWFQHFLSCLRLKGHILQTVMDSFQGCYKDGTEPGTRDYRWFAAFPLILRIFGFALIPFTLDCSYFPWGTTISIFGLLLTNIIQPYKEKFAMYAKIDCIFLAFIAITFAMIDGKNLSDIFHPSLTQVNTTISGVSFTAPIFYMVGITVYWILSKMKQSGRWWNRFKAQRAGYRDIEEDLPDRLVNPQNYQGSLLNKIVSDTNICPTEDTY